MYLCVEYRYQACAKLGKWAVMYLCFGHRYQACTSLAWNRLGNDAQHNYMTAHFPSLEQAC
jgi:hypothetical protein